MGSLRAFFQEEAREYIAKIVGLASGSRSPDAAEFHRIAKALRGSAQIARENRVQEVAGTLEAAGRALERRSLAWSSDIGDRVHQTVEDLRALVAADGSPDSLEERVANAVERWREVGVEPAVPGIAAAAPARTFPPPTAPKPPTPVGPTPVPGQVHMAPPQRSVAPRPPARHEPERMPERPPAREPQAPPPEPVEPKPVKRQYVEHEPAPRPEPPRPPEPRVGPPEAREPQPTRQSPQPPPPTRPAEPPREREGGVRAPRAPAGPDIAEPAEWQPWSPGRATRQRIAEEPTAAPPPIPPWQGSPPTAPRRGAAEEEFPVEVLNFFRSESRLILNRLERIAEELARATSERVGGLREEIAGGLAALRDTALTFGFGPAGEAAERARARAGTAAGDEISRLVERLRGVMEHPEDAAADPPEEPLPPWATTPTSAAAEPAGPSPVGGIGRPALEPGAPQDATHGADSAEGRPIDQFLYRGDAALRRAAEVRQELEESLADPGRARELLAELSDLLELARS